MGSDDAGKTVQSTSYLSVSITSCLLLLIPSEKVILVRNWARTAVKCNIVSFFSLSRPNEVNVASLLFTPFVSVIYETNCILDPIFLCKGHTVDRTDVKVKDSFFLIYTGTNTIITS